MLHPVEADAASVRKALPVRQTATEAAATSDLNIYNLDKEHKKSKHPLGCRVSEDTGCSDESVRQNHTGSQYSDETDDGEENVSFREKHTSECKEHPRIQRTVGRKAVPSVGEVGSGNA